MHISKAIYGNRPKDEEDRDRMLRFARLEQECDEYNISTINSMDKEHFNKTKTKLCDSMVKRWRKESSRYVKKLINATPYPFNNPRTWIVSI